MQQTRFTHSARHICMVVLLLLVGISGRQLHAQVTTGSVLGVVTDRSGAVIPNAEISIVDVDRNLNKATKASGNGTYRIDFLLPGNYKLSISAPGFKTYVQAGITLDAGVPVSIDAKLDPGAVS